MGAWTISLLTFREAARRWILWVALLLGVVFLVVYAIGFSEIQRDISRRAGQRALIEYNEIYNFMLLAGLYAVNFMCVVMTVLTSVDTLSGEIASGTIHTLVSKPLRRSEVVLGKWLGFAGLLLLYLLLMAGGVVAIVYSVAGYTPPHLGRGLALMAGNILLLLSLSFLGSASFSTLANGALVFGLYGVAFIGGWIEQFGGLLNNPTAINIGIACSLLLPSETLWKRAAYEMQSPLVSALGFSPFTSSTIPSALMVAYAGLYAAVALYLALRRFGSRDL